MFASERIEDGIERVFEIHFIARYVSNFRCLARYTFPAAPLPNSDNSSYLSNLFRKEVGMTITEYVTNHRILHAADLLLTSMQPVKTIAKQVGFADVQYFSRVFKKKMGKTPSQFRLERG